MRSCAHLWWFAYQRQKALSIICGCPFGASAVCSNTNTGTRFFSDPVYFSRNAPDWDGKCSPIALKTKSLFFFTDYPSPPINQLTHLFFMIHPAALPKKKYKKANELFLVLVQPLKIFQSGKELTQPTVHIIYSEVAQKRVPDVTKTNPNKYREHQLQASLYSPLYLFPFLEWVSHVRGAPCWLSNLLSFHNYNLHFNLFYRTLCTIPRYVPWIPTNPGRKWL